MANKSTCKKCRQIAYCETCDAPYKPKCDLAAHYHGETRVLHCARCTAKIAATDCLVGALTKFWDVEHETPGYLTVQVDRMAVEEARAALAAVKEKP